MVRKSKIQKLINFFWFLSGPHPPSPPLSPLSERSKEPIDELAISYVARKSKNKFKSNLNFKILKTKGYFTHLLLLLPSAPSFSSSHSLSLSLYILPLPARKHFRPRWTTDGCRWKII
jgi:hypothetical protein